MPTAVIIGSAGQDGRLLQSLLRSKGYRLTEVTRASHDISDFETVKNLILQTSADQVYYLAAEHGSSEKANSTSPRELAHRSWRVHVEGVTNCLESIRLCRPTARLLFAGSSRVFGSASGTFNESSPFAPNDIYGITKAAGIELCRLYRSDYHVFASTAILFNHESPLRGPTYLSQRVARGVAEIKLGRRERLQVGNLAAEVDWGWAPDYVAAMVGILLHGNPDDFVVATGKAHSVRDLLQAAFDHVGLNWEKYVDEIPSLVATTRPTLIGDASKLRNLTKWAPSIDFVAMVQGLVDAQLKNHLLPN